MRTKWYDTLCKRNLLYFVGQIHPLHNANKTSGITQRMCEGPLQLTGAQQRDAERCSLAADIIYCGLRHNDRAKPFPGELTTKEPKKIPVHGEIHGKVPACSRNGSSYCTRAVCRRRGRAREQRRQLCLRSPAASLVCLPSCCWAGGERAASKVLLLALNSCCQWESCPCDKRGSACCKHCINYPWCCLRWA